MFIKEMRDGEVGGGSYFMVLNTRFQRSHAESWYREKVAIRNLLFSKLRAQTNYSLTFPRKGKKKKNQPAHMTAGKGQNCRVSAIIPGGGSDPLPCSCHT